MNWDLVSKISRQETFAEGSRIRELHRLVDTYGGKTWKKCKGIANIRIHATGEIMAAELQLVRSAWDWQS